MEQQKVQDSRCDNENGLVHDCGAHSVYLFVTGI